MTYHRRPEIKVAPPGPLAQKIIAQDQQYASPSYIKEYPLVVSHAHEMWVHDVDGNCYMDLMAGIAVASTGHCHPQVVESIRQASEKLLHICGTDFYYESFSSLCERLANLLPGMGSQKVFLTNSGTEAVDGVIKLARHHTKRAYLIAFKGAFHGRTYGAISLNASKTVQKSFFGPLLPGVIHVPYACNPFEVIEQDLFIHQVAPQEVAAIIVEPILGEGGYVIPPTSFLQDLRTICDKYGILLIFDEIQSGIGRTGHMLAASYFGVMPDAFLIAKGLGSGLPIGAIVARTEVMTWPRGSHGSTFGGNPVACAAALKTLDIVQSLLPQIQEVGALFLQGLRALKKKHSVIADVRGVGLMIGCEFLHPLTKQPLKQYVSNLEQQAFRHGLLLLSCGQSTIRFAPPLVMIKEEVDVALEILDLCLTQLRVE